jgi:hypothetical protein
MNNELHLMLASWEKRITKEGVMSEETNNKLLEYRRTEKLVLQRQARERAERIRIANRKGK